MRLPNIRALVALAIFVIIFSELSAVVVSYADILPVSPVPLGFENAADVDVNVSSSISEDGLEDATYTITIHNELNSSLRLEIYLNFEGSLLNVSLEKDDRKLNLSRYGSEQSYKAIVDIPANTITTYLLKFRRYVLPSMWELGLWGLKYRYVNPMRLEAHAKHGAGVSVVYHGTIVLASKPERVDCSTCVYDAGTGEVNIQNSEYFWISWEIKRTPYKAALFYILMLAALVVYGRRFVK